MDVFQYIKKYFWYTGKYIKNCSNFLNNWYTEKNTRNISYFSVYQKYFLMTKVVRLVDLICFDGTRTSIIHLEHVVYKLSNKNSTVFQSLANFSCLPTVSCLNLRN